MIRALPASNWPWAGCWICASARCAIPQLCAGNAASSTSGRRAFCGIIQASTSWNRGPSHRPRMKSRLVAEDQTRVSITG